MEVGEALSLPLSHACPNGQRPFRKMQKGARWKRALPNDERRDAHPPCHNPIRY